MLTSTSEVLTPAELSMASVLRRTPRRAASMRPALGAAEIGAFADHLGADLRAGDADRIVGAVADLLVGLGRGAHIGADAAEPEQVDRRLQDRAHDLGGRRLGLRRGRAAPATSGESGIDLAARENTPPPVEISALS